MTDLVAELAERGRSLALEDRSRLVELLLDTLHEPPLAEIEAAWDKEIERRIAAYERGEGGTSCSNCLLRGHSKGPGHSLSNGG